MQAPVPKPKKSLEGVRLYETSEFKPPYRLKLDANENLFGPSPKVMQKLRNLQACEVFSYPVYGALRKRLADFNSVQPENILVTNGADEAIYAILQTYLEPEDTLLTASPTFAMPKIYSSVIGTGVLEVFYKNRWEFPIEEFLDKIDERVKVVHLTTPNNPTGDVISKSDVERILVKSQGKIVIIDEVYANFSGVCYLELLKKYKNTVIVRSFSKDFALAGLRLGYIIADKSIAEQVKKVLSPYNVNNIAVLAGCEAIDDFQHFEAQKAEFEASKSKLTAVFTHAGAVVYESSANFLCVDFGERAEFVYRRLLGAGIKVRYFGHGGGLDGVLRVTVPPLMWVDEIEKALVVRDLLVFDMDGVIVDTSRSYRLAIQKTYEEFAGMSVSFELIQSAKELGGLNNDWDLTEYLLKQAGVEVGRAELVAKFQEFYWADGKGLINDEALVLDKSVLAALAKKYDLAVFTGRPRSEAVYTLELNGIKELFCSIITMDDLPQDKQKPCPLGLEKIKNSALFEKVYYLGDTPDDMKCAVGAGAIGVGVLPPHCKSDSLKEGLIQSGAMVVLDDVNNISTTLERLK